MAVEDFDIEARWPELFAPLDDRQRQAVVNALASSWHEGWVPNREDVENLTDVIRGAIDRDEYARRAQGAARQHSAHPDRLHPFGPVGSFGSERRGRGER